MKEEFFRKWYDAREGTKSESFAWDVWCAAWVLSRIAHDAEEMASETQRCPNHE